MKQFLTKSEFAKLVEKAVIANKMTYMDAVLSLCDENGIDPEDSKKFISGPIMEKLEAEAMKLNLIPRGNELSFE